MTNWNTEALVVTEMTEEEMRLELNRVKSAICIHTSSGNREQLSKARFRKQAIMDEQVRRFYQNHPKVGEV